MHSHAALGYVAERLARAQGFGQDDVFFSQSAPSHLVEQTSLDVSLLVGAQTYFASSVSPLAELREVRPTSLVGTPAFWQGLREQIEERLAREPVARGKVVAWARRLALERRRLESELRMVPAHLASQHKLARALVLAPLKESLGLQEARHLLCGLSRLPAGLLDFFSSIELPLFELYGQSETAGPVCVNGPGSERLGSQGRPLFGTEVRIAEDQEVWLRGPGTSSGYLGVPAGRNGALDSAGWLHTGDLGQLDSDGFLRILGRKAELLRTASGRAVLARRLEERLSSIALVTRAHVFSEGRGTLVAVLELDPAHATRFAQERGLPSDLAVLSRDPSLIEHLQAEVDAVGAEHLESEKVGRIAIVPAKLSVEAGELTPTGEARRHRIAERYLISAEPVRRRPSRSRARVARRRR
jgi:long-chain acyl-CoA synthetase